MHLLHLLYYKVLSDYFTHLPTFYNSYTCPHYVLLNQRMLYNSILFMIHRDQTGINLHIHRTLFSHFEINFPIPLTTQQVKTHEKQVVMSVIASLTTHSEESMKIWLHIQSSQHCLNNPHTKTS